LVDTCKAEGLDEMVKVFELNLKFGNSHLDCVSQFGRYPGRNTALGRENTPEEEEYLKTANT